MIGAEQSFARSALAGLELVIERQVVMCFDIVDRLTRIESRPDTVHKSIEQDVSDDAGLHSID